MKRADSPPLPDDCGEPALGKTSARKHRKQHKSQDEGADVHLSKKSKKDITVSSIASVTPKKSKDVHKKTKTPGICNSVRGLYNCELHVRTESI